jgi:hypothetical protein
VGFSSPAAEGTALATFEGASADERFEEPGDLVVHRSHDEASADPNMASAVTPTVSRESKQPGRCRMIFPAEATIMMTIRRNGASTPLTIAAQ